jgi:NADPH:quinone reductase-like Zn-dependent oxidoreductase
MRVRVHAAALNRLDWWVLNGIPGVKTIRWVLIRRAGVIESVGSGCVMSPSEIA